MIFKIVMVVVVALAAVLLFAATRPNTFRVQRSLLMAAPPEQIFPFLDNVHAWPKWVPQDREDPSMQRTCSGAEHGAGAVSRWFGNGSTGRGQMTIAESDPPKNIVVRTDFTLPFEAHNVNEFVLERDGESTRVTWTMHGTNLYPMKLMSVFVNMDRLMGTHFETGLENVKQVASGT